MDYLVDEILEKNIRETTKRLFYQANYLPAYTYYPKLSAKQAFKLMLKYDLAENLDVFEDIDSYLADLLLECEYVDVLNEMLESCTLNNIYIIGSYLSIATSVDDFHSLISENLIGLNEIEDLDLLVDVLAGRLDESIEIYDPKLKVAIHSDDRGKHSKFFVDQKANKLGFGEVKEVFMTTNNKGALRGLHRQTGLKSQQKLIKVVNGSFNVRLFIPNDKNVIISNQLDNVTKVTKVPKGIVLSYNNMDEMSDPIFAPEGALLGYVSLEDNSKMLYLADADFNASEDEGYQPIVDWIDWGYDLDKIIVSDRDKIAPEYK